MANQRKLRLGAFLAGMGSNMASWRHPEDRVAAVLARDVGDQLHDNDRLAHSGAPEQADLAPLGIRRQEIDDLDSGLQNRVGRERVHER